MAGDNATQQRALDSFHAVMAQLDGTMLLVTAASSDGEQNGCLVGFATQCGIDPARYMVFLSKANHTFDVAQQADALGVHFPAPEQTDIAARFGTRTGDRTDKMGNEAWHPGPHGVPILEEVARWFVGRVLERIDCGDHVGFLLDPIAANASQHDLRQLGFQAVKELDAGHDA
ncbi:MAG TPA: flavin reductase family protein [Sporichthya sp.]|nr:flavin reductase family protein [Sporichthya sp.]